MTYVQGRLMHRDEIVREPRPVSFGMLEDLAGNSPARLRSMLIEPDRVFMHDWDLSLSEFQASVNLALRKILM